MLKTIINAQNKLISVTEQMKRDTMLLSDLVPDNSLETPHELIMRLTGSDIILETPQKNTTGIAWRHHIN